MKRSGPCSARRLERDHDRLPAGEPIELDALARGLSNQQTVIAIGSDERSVQSAVFAPQFRDSRVVDLVLTLKQDLVIAHGKRVRTLVRRWPFRLGCEFQRLR